MPDLDPNCSGELPMFIDVADRQHQDQPEPGYVGRRRAVEPVRDCLTAALTRIWRSL